MNDKVNSVTFIIFKMFLTTKRRKLSEINHIFLQTRFRYKLGKTTTNSHTTAALKITAG